MSPTHLPQTQPASRRASRVAFITAAIVSFSLTLLAGGVALIAGVLPMGNLNPVERLDIGAVLLFVPICALVLGILAEVVRISLRSPALLTEPLPQRVIWPQAARRP